MTQTPKACRAGNRCTPTTFAESVDCLAHHSDVSLAVAAERIGRDASYLRKACSQYDDTHPLRGDLIVPLTLAFANDALVEYLARATGGVFVRVPAAQPGVTDMVGLTGAVMDQVGSVLQDVARSVADGSVTASEAESLARVIDGVIGKAEALKRLARSKAT